MLSIGPGASNQSGDMYPMGVRLPDGLPQGMGMQAMIPTLGEMMIVQEPTQLGNDSLGLSGLSNDERIITRIENPAMQLMQAGQMQPPHMMIPPGMTPGELMSAQQQHMMMMRQPQMQMQMQMPMSMPMQMQMPMSMAGAMPMPLPMHMQTPDMAAGAMGGSPHPSALASLLDQPHFGQQPALSQPQSLPQQQLQSVPRPGSASISDPYAYAPAPSFAPPTPGPMPATPGRVAPAPSAPQQAQSQQTPQSVPPTVNSGASSASGSSANSTPNGVAPTGGRDRPGSRPQSRPSLTPTPKLESSSDIR